MRSGTIPVPRRDDHDRREDRDDEVVGAAEVDDGSDPGRGTGLERFVWGVIGVVSVLAVWELLNRTHAVSDALLSSPTEVAKAGINEYKSGELWKEVWTTLSTWWLGFAIAAVVGVLIGLLAGASRWVGYVVDPWLRVLYSIPELALIPILVVWLGLGSSFRVFIVFLSSIFYIAINALTGARSVDHRYFEVARVYDVSRRHTFVSVVLPGAFPYILTGLRQGASRGLVGAVIAEFLASNSGIGYMITTAGATLDTARVMFGVVVLALFGIVSGELLRRLEAHFERWREG